MIFPAVADDVADDGVDLCEGDPHVRQPSLARPMVRVAIQSASLTSTNPT